MVDQPSDSSVAGSGPRSQPVPATSGAQLRIFSYLPNPRLWKATIAARLCGVEIEIRGASVGELAGWLWDFDARPLSEVASSHIGQYERASHRGFDGRSLFKSDAFLDAHPFGTVPAAFNPDGAIGIFESNSIMRAVARLGNESVLLYGKNAYEASRIDSFLDVSLIFGRDTQSYLLALRAESVTRTVRQSATTALEIYLSGIERALRSGGPFLVGKELSLADICFVSELALFLSERRQYQILRKKRVQPITWQAHSTYPLAFEHLARLSAFPAFAPDVGPYLEGVLSGATPASKPSKDRAAHPVSP